MAELTTQQRQEISADVQRRLSRLNVPCGATKAQLMDVIAAADAYLDANATAMNQAIPAGARAAASSEVKAIVLAAVAYKRYGGNG